MTAPSAPARKPLPSTERYRSAFRAGLFDGKTVIVTGGGSGLGRCTVHELVSLGARVAVIGRQTAKLDAVVNELAALYPERVAGVSQHVCDIRIEEGVQRTVASGERVMVGAVGA